MSIKAAVYCRVSSDEQRENQTIETQQDVLARWLAFQNGTYEVVDWYLDDGVSGTLPWEERREGSRLVSDARRKAFDVVLCYEVSRLGRDDFGRFIINLAFDLQNLGIAIISTTENIDTSSEDGRLLLLIKAGLAGHERARLLRRSIDGTNHWAREGVWLGGIVPYGYRKIGSKKTARIVPAEEKLPGQDLSEADVVRLMYRMLADEGLSCFKIADYLNAIGVPPAYAKVGREVEVKDPNAPEGKRKKATAGIWRPSRIRNLVTNTVYKGVHLYGKRSKKPRETIERDVLPLVDPHTWQRAQETLHKNLLFSRRNAKRRYLLRGLVKCQTCGCNYVGSTFHGPGRRPKIYYRCGGQEAYRGRCMGRCTSKAVNGEFLEDAVWGDIVGFIEDPGDVLAALAEERQQESEQVARIVRERANTEAALSAKARERDRVLDAYRKGIIESDDLEREMGKTRAEAEALREHITHLDGQLEAVSRAAEDLRSADSLLRELRQRLAEPLSWKIRRQLVELLVSEIRVDTDCSTKPKTVKIVVVYRFDGDVSNRTGRDSWRPPA
jgi:site-specific DNA recombinase